MRLDIFYQSGWFIQYQTTMRFTFVELLGGFKPYHNFSYINLDFNNVFQLVLVALLDFFWAPRC